MPIEPDYRAQKMESSEGRGFARARRERWWDHLPDDARAGIDGARGTSPEAFKREVGEEASARFWERVAADARERTELVGFWVAWHRAGGFRALAGVSGLLD